MFNQRWRAKILEVYPEAKQFKKGDEVLVTLPDLEVTDFFQPRRRVGGWHVYYIAEELGATNWLL